MMPFYGSLSADDERIGVLIAAWEMLRSGTTCFLDMGALVDPGGDRSRARRRRDPRGHRPARGRRPAGGAAAGLVRGDDGASLLPRHGHRAARAPGDRAPLGRTRGRTDPVLGEPPGKELCSPRLFVEGRALAQELGVGMTYHLASTLEEAPSSQRRFGAWPITRMAEMGDLVPNVVLAHAVAALPHEVRILAETSTKVALCPGTSLKLAKGATRIGRYSEMIQEGVTVSLGTDGVSASGNLSMMRQMYLAAGLFKDSRRDPSMVGARQAVRMATIDGARALGLDAEIGSLKIGKQADLVLWDLEHPEWVVVPGPDPGARLVGDVRQRRGDMGHQGAGSTGVASWRRSPISET